MQITYDAKLDLRNWLRIKVKNPAGFFITQHYPFDKTIPLAQENVEKLAKSIKPETVEAFKTMAESIKSQWQKHESKVVAAIYEYLGNVKPITNYKTNLTTTYLMPYDERDNWFMVPTHKTLPEQIKVITHELFHLYYVEKYPDASLAEREAEVEKFLRHLV